jgi:hypothetical protein
MYPRLSILRPRHHALHHRPPAIGSNPCFSLTLESCSMVLPHCLPTRRVNGCPWCAMALSTAKLTRGRTPEIGRVWKAEVWIVTIRRTSDTQKRPVALRSPRTSSIMLRIRFIVTCVLRLFSHCPWWIRSSRMLGPIRCIVAGVCSGEKEVCVAPGNHTDVSSERDCCVFHGTPLSSRLPERTFRSIVCGQTQYALTLAL